MTRDFAIVVACIGVFAVCISILFTIGFINNTPEFYGEIIAKAVKAYNIEMSKP